MNTTLPEVRIKKQVIHFSDTSFKNMHLHEIQKRLLNIKELPQVSIFTAPTGSGKSYAFPLPVLNHNNTFEKMRGLVILPTNALIENLFNIYKRDFPLLKIGKLTSKVLTEHGYERWDELISIIDQNELIITNPDLINWIIFGGYYTHKGQRGFSELFTKIRYWVIDEYHLWDEEQIGQILCWLKIQCYLFPAFENNFIFASATPEKGLKELLDAQEIPFAEFRETSSDTTENGRIIHGETKVSFLKNQSFLDWFERNKKNVYQWVRQSERILVIYDNLKVLQLQKKALKQLFPDLRIAEESGWQTKAIEKEDVNSAQIILGTNKVEVGITLENVNILLMQPGKYLRNFIQRLGRVARGESNGKVFVFDLNGTKRLFNGLNSLDYYEFYEKIASLQQLKDKKFYAETVPAFMGAFLFNIQKNSYNAKKKRGDYQTQQILRNKIHRIGQELFIYGVLQSLDFKIKNLEKLHFPDAQIWKEWWRIYLSTFKYFRGTSKNIKVCDRDENDKETEYSLEWILTHRNIVDRKGDEENPTYIVSGFKEGKPELMYIVSSLPVNELLMDNRFITQKDKYNIKRKYKKAVEAIIQSKFKYDIENPANRIGKEICEDLLKLQSIFTLKRLEIVDIYEQNIFL